MTDQRDNRRTFETFLYDLMGGRFDACEAALAEDVVWHVSPFAGMPPLQGRARAGKFFRRAQAAGHPRAEAKLRLLRAARVLEADPPPETTAGELVDLAVMFAGDGTPGRALQLLERVLRRSNGLIH